MWCLGWQTLLFGYDYRFSVLAFPRTMAGGLVLPIFSIFSLSLGMFSCYLSIWASCTSLQKILRRCQTWFFLITKTETCYVISTKTKLDNFLAYRRKIYILTSTQSYLMTAMNGKSILLVSAFRKFVQSTPGLWLK